jgi:hypothetical protein
LGVYFFYSFEIIDELAKAEIPEFRPALGAEEDPLPESANEMDICLLPHRMPFKVTTNLKNLINLNKGQALWLRYNQRNDSN